MIVSGRLALVAAQRSAACPRPDRNQDPSHQKSVAPAAGATRGADAMAPTNCDAARRAITAHHFLGWRGLAAGCAPEAVFGIPFDEQWGVEGLGSSFERARARLLDLGGYYRPMAYVRDGRAEMFDAMSPALDPGWPALSADLGVPEATFDWVFGTVPMPRGERVWAGRGITIWLNPENEKVVYVTVYAPTTVDDYVRRLRPSREKRMIPKQ